MSHARRDATAAAARETLRQLSPSCRSPFAPPELGPTQKLPEPLLYAGVAVLASAIARHTSRGASPEPSPHGLRVARVRAGAAVSLSGGSATRFTGSAGLSSPPSR